MEGLVLSKELATFLAPLELEVASVHTQFNSSSGIKYRGNPTENCHDLATVDYNGNIIICQFLCFLDISAKHILSTSLDDINKARMYAIVNFVDQNVFSCRLTKPLYGTAHNK